MASIIKTSINLNNIPKDKIFEGKKGKYLPITITINNDLDQFGNQGPVVVEQTKETNFYKNQSHVKAVDNLRRSTGATKKQMQRMFNQINQYA